MLQERVHGCQRPVADLSSGIIASYDDARRRYRVRGCGHVHFGCLGLDLLGAARHASSRKLTRRFVSQISLISRNHLSLWEHLLCFNSFTKLALEYPKEVDVLYVPSM